jgi:hypothetical protein
MCEFVFRSGVMTPAAGMAESCSGGAQKIVPVLEKIPPSFLEIRNE